MRKNRWIFAIVVAASFGWAACDEDDNPLDRPNLNETDETFVETAATNNMAEIKFGELAATKANDSTVRVFARQMVNEHKTAQDELKDIADDFRGVEWPDGVTKAHDDLLAQLDDADGYTFDTLYMRTQVMMHEDAVAAFRTATTNTTEVRVKSYATKYLPKIEMHLEKADSIHTVIMADDGTN